mmetsp:Transcript_63821/g.170987  ORF Transcript_63821/g.170987 Transcript_63821/m.170987 type:complete len:110 (+) Transcript_63821:1015-1344(+)
MTPAAGAFGNLMPYIRNEAEFNTAINAWIRSHLMFRRFSMFNSSSKSNDVRNEQVFVLDIKPPHSCKCAINALILMSGARSVDDGRVIAILGRRCAQNAIVRRIDDMKR